MLFFLKSSRVPVHINIYDTNYHYGAASGSDIHVNVTICTKIGCNNHAFIWQNIAF